MLDPASARASIAYRAMAREPGGRAASHCEDHRARFLAAFEGLVKEVTEGLENPEISDGIRHLEAVSRCYQTTRLSCLTLHINPTGTEV